MTLQSNNLLVVTEDKIALPHQTNLHLYTDSVSDNIVSLEVTGHIHQIWEIGGILDLADAQTLRLSSGTDCPSYKFYVNTVEIVANKDQPVTYRITADLY